MIMSSPSFYVPQWLYLLIVRKISRVLEYILKFDKIILQSAYLSAFYMGRVVLKISRLV